MEKQYIPPLIKKILNNRGFRSEESMHSFLFSGVSSLCDPFAIPDMKKACGVLADAIAGGEKVFLYGDGDVDGICAAFLLASFMNEKGVKNSFYLTHRLEENYEIEEALIRDIEKSGYSLLITVDCGISSLKALKRAEEAGIKCIVLDHHIGKPSSLPGFHIYINPYVKEWDESVRFLSGAGIAYKFIAGMEQLLPDFKEKKISDMLEIPCLATLADFVPMTGENRIFVKEGLRKLAFTSIKGLRQLMDFYNLKPPFYAKDAIMKLNPKLNSPGRFGKPEIVLELFLEKDEAAIEKLIAEVDGIDRERYKAVNKIIKKIAVSDETDNGFVVSQDSYKGFSGIIASRLSGQYNRPFIVCYENNNVIKGSIRAPDGYCLHGISSEMGQYMDEMGGHRNAMGFRCSSEHLEKLKVIWVNTKWQRDTEERYDCELDVDELNPVLINEIFQYLEPFGKGNPVPVFLCRDVELRSVRAESLSAERCWVKRESSFYEAFIINGKKDIPSGGAKADIYYTPYLREAGGLYRIFLKISDFKNQ